MSILRSFRALFSSGKGIAVGMPEASSYDDPIRLFGAWFAAAHKSGLLVPEAMTLATASSDGKPSARMVLLKDFSSDGFVFYTNYRSRKASELDENPIASLLFHWPILQRQVRIEGATERVDRQKAETYFHSRPRGSQIGAWASQQSSELDSRATLRANTKHYESKFKDQEVPLPDHWGGYRLDPSRMEFWQGRLFRLHDRIVFERKTETAKWDVHRLYP